MMNNSDVIPADVKTILFLGVSSNHEDQIYKSLEGFFSLFNYEVKKINDVVNDSEPTDNIVLYLEDLNYTTIATPKFGLVGKEKDCLYFINKQTQSQKKICLITPKKNSPLFENINIEVSNLVGFFGKDFIPKVDENLKSIAEIFRKSGHRIHAIPAKTEYSTTDPTIDSAKKTVLVMDDLFCNSSNTLSRFFIENMKELGKQNSMNLLFTNDPMKFFDYIKQHRIDTVLVDLDYSEWLRSKDSYAPENTEYFSSGYEKIGWEIMRKIVHNTFKGFLEENNGSDDDSKKESLHELPPNIYVFTCFDLTEKPENPNSICYEKEGKPIKPIGFAFSNGSIICEEYPLRISILSKTKLSEEVIKNLNKEIDLNVGSNINNKRWNGVFLLTLRKMIKDKEIDKNIYIKYKNENDNLIVEMGSEQDFSLKMKLKPYINVIKEEDNKIDKIQSKVMSSIRKYAEHYKRHQKAIIEDDDILFNSISPYYTPKDSVSNHTSEVEFVGEKYENPIFLASTPITGIQVQDINKAKKWYYDKLRQLLNTGVGAIVLKTSCYEIRDYRGDTIIENKNPQTRVYYKRQDIDVKGKKKKKDGNIYLDGTFYNTGNTATENMSLHNLCEFLSGDIAKYSSKIIPSVASKSDNEIIWKEIFSKLEKLQKYNVFEINARYTIRGILLEDDLANIYDEYLIYGRDLNYFYNKFEGWIHIINKLAIESKKKIVVKLPFRTDLLNLMKICKKYNLHKDYGIKGLTLINTIKAPYPFRENYNNEKDIGFIHHDKDSFGLPQMSGKGLKYLRDWVLFQVSNHLNDKKDEDKDLDISASGGITDIDDLRACFSMGARTVQIGTIALMKGTAGIRDILSSYEKNIKIYSKSASAKREKGFSERYVKTDHDECTRCGNCLRSYYCDAFTNRSYNIIRNELLRTPPSDLGKITIPPPYLAPIIDPKLCRGCGLCVQLCEKPEKALITVYMEEKDN